MVVGPLVLGLARVKAAKNVYVYASLLIGRDSRMLAQTGVVVCTYTFVKNGAIFLERGVDSGSVA